MSTQHKIDANFFKNFTSEHTRKSYRIDLEKFFLFIEEYFKTLPSIERAQIIEYRNYLAEAAGPEGKPLAPKSIARKLAAISSYFDFLVEKGDYQMNPATSVKRPRREVKTPTQALSTEQVEELFHAIETTKGASRFLHRALLITFFTTGMRKSEILELKYGDYRIINGHYVLEYTGKGGKIGQKLLHPKAVEAVEEYLASMNERGRKHEKEDWLFQPTRNPSNPKNLNKPLNPKTINEILDHYAKKIGLGFKISPHSARATFISELLAAGVDIYNVAREVNHSSVKTTQQYDKRRKQFSDSPILKLPY